MSTFNYTRSKALFCTLAVENSVEVLIRAADKLRILTIKRFEKRSNYLDVTVKAPFIIIYWCCVCK